MKRLVQGRWPLLLLVILFAISFSLILVPGKKALAAPYNLRWSYAGPVTGMVCTRILEPSDPYTWDDNYLCAPSDMGFTWKSNGIVSGQVCVRFLETADPDTWSDNYLCSSTDYKLQWSSAGPITGADCLQINEPSDPYTWNDNYLCGPTASPTTPPPTTPPPVANVDKPYFQTQFGGPFAGGGFDDGSCSTNYESPYGGSTTDYYKGAIMAFGTVSGGSRQGAHSSLDAFALGKIEGNSDPAKQYGFYTGTKNTDTGGLSFSNSGLPGSDFWGGNLEGASAPGAHCIPDYYEKFKDLPGATTGSSPITTDGSTKTISAGDKQIVFVEGNAYIGGNIQYDLGYNADNIPKYALVVKGNIYIGKDVNRLDGWYIAQPGSSGGGEIWTCHENSSTQPTDTWMRTSCGNDLTINGALTAAHVYLGRISGDITGGAAETINYTPEMVLGGAFFEDTSESGDATGAIQSLVNLPPIF